MENRGCNKAEFGFPIRHFARFRFQFAQQLTDIRPATCPKRQVPDRFLTGYFKLITSSGVVTSFWFSGNAMRLGPALLSRACHFCHQCYVLRPGGLVGHQDDLRDQRSILLIIDRVALCGRAASTHPIGLGPICVLGSCSDLSRGQFLGG